MMMDSIGSVNSSRPSDASYNVQETVSVREVQGDTEEKTPTGYETLQGDNSVYDMEKQVSEAIKKVNEDERFRRTGCEFTYHKESKRISITLFDRETKEVIKEIPPEDTIKMLDKMHELAGLIMDEKK